MRITTTPMNILALDQATTTGFCVVDEAGQIHASGVWKLADPKRTGESRGMRYIRFEAELRKAIERWEPKLIVHEQTILRGGAPTEIANGLKAIILKEAAVYGLDVSCVHATELKHWATGNGRAEKSAMIATAEAYMLQQGAGVPHDDNEADAVLIALWSASKFGTFPAPVFPDKPKKKRSRRSSDPQVQQLLNL